jgi:hypothetical protein
MIKAVPPYVHVSKTISAVVLRLAHHNHKEVPPTHVLALRTVLVRFLTSQVP